MFLIPFSVYNLNRKTDEMEDEINHVKRFKFIQKYGKYLYFASIFSYLVALMIAGMYGIIVLLIALIPLITGILYSVPLFPGNYRFRRLKEIPAIKNITLGLAWAITLSFLPVFMASEVPSGTTYIVFIFLYSFFFINTTFFDMRDVEGDRQAGVYTIPVLLGISKTILALSVINIILGAIVIIYYLKAETPFELIIIVSSVLFTQLLLLIFDSYGSNNYLFDVVADGAFIIIGILLYAVSFVVSGITLIPRLIFV